MFVKDEELLILEVFKNLQWKTGSSKAMILAEGILQKLEEKYKTPEK